VGQAFRNEIVTKQYIFRTREFEQMELQYFLRPEDMESKYEEWKRLRWDWYLEYGIKEENLQWYEHAKLAHYAAAAYDIEYNFEALGGFKELEGIHQRGDWDLTQHAKFSGRKLEYRDPVTQETIVPHIMETSVGLNRLFFAFLHEAYTEEEVGEDVRTVLKLDKRLAPVKIAIFPLLKNKPELVDKAQEIFSRLSEDHMCEFDDNGNIGKRYRRQDEIGTPYCVTVDFDTLEKDDSVTVRDRDTMEQTRVKLSELNSFFYEQFK
jgi:glycyl-tRNA synthetase